MREPARFCCRMVKSPPPALANISSSPEKISDFDHEEQEWRVVPSEADPVEIDY